MMITIETKDLKKGMRVSLRNGWAADIMGSARGHTTMCKVYGFETEMGSVYTTDIQFVNQDGKFIPVVPSEGQRKAEKSRKAMGF